MFQVPNKNRVRGGDLASTSAYGNNGAFNLIHGDNVIICIAADGLGWEHVSVSVTWEDRCPTWEEMCFEEKIFWLERVNKNTMALEQLLTPMAMLELEAMNEVIVQEGVTCQNLK